MVSWREESVDDAAAHRLLTEYFEARAADFPGGPGAYRTVFPTADQFVPPRGVFLVVEDVDDRGLPADVGCGGIREIAAGATGRRFEVKHLYLRPVTRGRGLGRALLGELEREARGFGAVELVLDTNSSLTAAGGLYRSSGFVNIPAYNDNPNATNWYSKRLD
ncbi:GNAT family N-acetyltransferase [Lacisediminihabitans profunda]|uniref:GNAT family N-acetyltransferase n=1 Tax=Lacisediminihabitans profunda TaxID=2594790 RepID=A0A5C8UU90_9MICO|nr:GNAT family N-acetyltransferase [Lacisediminihabitans profunda]TXN31520.1 GNAT family N-acetyltransferase [Lacisediminihabitans profunda]